MQRAVRILKRVFTALAFIVAVLCVIGIVVYLLYRVADFNSLIYAYVYLAAVVMLFFYFLYWLIRRKYVSRALLRVAWGLVVILSVCVILAAIFLYGALCIRLPLVGFISAPIIIFCLVYFLPRVRFFSRLKRYFS